MIIVHAADLHIDSPLRGLELYEGAPTERIRQATRRAFENLVDHCLARGATALLLAGDVFDGDWKDFSTGLFFVRQLARLRGETEVFIVRGNHDAASQVTRQLPLPDHVHEFPKNAPTTIERPGWGMAFHGMSFPERAVKKNLVPGYPPPVPGVCNVGLLHTNATGSASHDPYAPCTVEELRAKGYDYWALGHVHQREVLSERPWVVYPGNTQGRHIREAGAKGCMELLVEGGSVASVEFVPLDVLRWTQIDVELDQDESLDSLNDRLFGHFERLVSESDGRLTAVRVLLSGSCRAYGEWTSGSGREELLNTVRNVAVQFPDEIWLEKVRPDLQPLRDPRDAAENNEFLGDLLAAVQDFEHQLDSPEALDEIAAPMMAKLAEPASAVLPRDAEERRQLVARARDLVLSRLLGPEGSGG